MKVRGALLVGIVAGIAGACGSSNDQPGGSGGSGAVSSAGKGGMSAGGSGASAGKGGSSAGSAGRGRGGTNQGGAGGSAEAGGSGGDLGASGQGAAPSETGGSSGLGGSAGAGSAGKNGVGGTVAEGGSNESGGSAGDAGDSPGGSAGTAGTAGTPTTVTLSVDTSSEVHPISPLIYGVNPNNVACTDTSARFTLCRLGGNRWSSYNWENNASNGAADLCFQNDDALGGGDTAGGAVTETVGAADGAGAATLVTLPILDYVAADKATPGSGVPDCTGDVRKSGDDYLTTRFKQNVAAKGAPFVTPPDATDDSVYSDEFVAFLRDNTAGAHVLFGLDNQPALWGSTDVEIHPAAATYAEVVARNVTFAKSTRDQWPAAEISGYVGYGYDDFLDLQAAPDATGNGLFIDYYLAGLAQASSDDGRRLIDYLDVHWYPEVNAENQRIIENTSSTDARRARVQAPRSLWDPTYVEDSWITRDVNGSQPIRLVRWLKERIAANYPGTKLAVSEWSYGGGTDISGAVAAADALGIFGREQVELAAWATVTNDDPFVVAAFQMFRNYDGAGAKFGDTSVSATSSNLAAASVYASLDSGNANRLVIVAINRSEGDLTATLTVDDARTFTSADVFALTSAAEIPSAAPALTAAEANTFTYVMPSYSVSVIVPKSE